MPWREFDGKRFELDYIGYIDEVKERAKQKREEGYYTRVFVYRDRTVGNIADLYIRRKPEKKVVKYK